MKINGTESSPPNLSPTPGKQYLPQAGLGKYLSRASTLLFPPRLAQLLLQHVFKKPGLRGLTADGTTWCVRQEAGFSHHGRQRKVETCPFNRRSTRMPVPGRAPQNRWGALLPVPRAPNEPTDLLHPVQQLDNAKERCSSAKMIYERESNNSNKKALHLWVIILFKVD